ncbi:hypothetical protein DLH72_01810 [Candidatus Gracilibacteria bacterium]|nr:MAG: hypothetical protein DLH72_01810 [Candidatus Gracilibacteria bacterium]
MGFRDKGYKYFKPLHKSVNMQFNLGNWTKALKLYEKGSYKESLLELLKYADSKVKKYQTSENVFRIPHGSVFLDLDFSGENIKISSDFLDVSEANKVPLFRRIAELSFSGLNLTQIKLIENKLIFDFSCPVELYDPYKIFDVLAEICYFADKYDEEFCEQFGAKNLSDAEITQIPDSKKEKIWENFREIINSNFEIIKDLEERRKNNYAWDVISTTYKMIDYACAPKGSLALRISEKVSELYDREKTLDTIIFRGKEFLKEISEMPKEDFFKSIYEVKEFIPNKKVAGSELISEYLKPGYSDAYQDLQSGNIESAYVIFMHILYNSMYYHIMPYGMEQAIVRLIKRHSNTVVNKGTVANLSNGIYEIINLQNIPSSHSGFFGFIWGMIVAAIGFILSSLFQG